VGIETTTADRSGLLRRPDRVYDGYVLDLDGTVYLGDGPLPGAAEGIAGIRALGKRTVFLSNNPTRDPQMYADKLGGLGIPTPVTDIVNPVVTVPRWLQAHHPGAGVFVIGEEPLQRALTAAGVRLTERPEEIDVVVASFDRTFDYRKLQIAFDAIWFHGRAHLITSNPDRFCPMPGGRGEPDAAAVVAAIEACTGVTCEANLGKPGAEMLETVLGVLGLPVDRCVMVGDRLSTDIAMAARAGMDSALVLTGETTPGKAAALDPAGAPTWVLDRIDHLLPEGVGAVAEHPAVATSCDR
jgi:HAD superfamily hydrolase (TIGR01450 family)